MEIKVKGLDELIERFAHFPRQYHQAARTFMQAILLVIWEHMPPYPPKKPTTTSRRELLLGKSMGVDMSGQPMGSQPDIYEVEENGGYYSARFGSRLEYAPFVIGEGTQVEQNSHWWIVPRDVVERAAKKVQEMSQDFAEDLANFLRGKS